MNCAYIRERNCVEIRAYKYEHLEKERLEQLRKVTQNAAEVIFPKEHEKAKETHP